MLSGMLLAAICYYPIYAMMAAASGWDPIQPMSTAQNPNVPALIALVFIQVIFVTMVYGPIAAFLVELFPTRIRYTSMSLPYHIGNGVFGGLVPLIGTALVAQSGNIYAGLIYPISIALICFTIGVIYIHEKKHRISLDNEIL